MAVSQAACLHPEVTGERMIPLLPCASIDEIADFAVPLGFTVTYRQTRPNPYLALRREDIDLHYFGMDGFRPEDSYGTCVIISPEPKQLFDALAAGLRSRYGRLPLDGFPQITRPRRRKNADGFTGFSHVDPGGNWIRVTGGEPDDAPPDPGRLARALADAVVLGDSHGDVDQAAKIRRRDPASRSGGCARGTGAHRRPRTHRGRPDGSGGRARVGRGAAGPAPGRAGGPRRR